MLASVHVLFTDTPKWSRSIIKVICYTCVLVKCPRENTLILFTSSCLGNLMHILTAHYYNDNSVLYNTTVGSWLPHIYMKLFVMLSRRAFVRKICFCKSHLICTELKTKQKTCLLDESIKCLDCVVLSILALPAGG